ncbi:MAG: hypothetical protein ACRCUK_10750 [Plesiomonas shigelloides]
MNLTEGQLFTIEALNKIDGFVWPDGAEFAALDRDDVYINFFQNGALPYDDEAWIGKRLVNSSVNVGAARIDWRNSLITREQFESVDGWVRHTGNSMPDEADEKRIDYMMRSGVSWDYCTANNLDWDSSCHADDIIKWRYSKQSKETDMQPEVPKQPSIDELYSQYKTQHGIVEAAKKTLADEMEAEDKLLEQIKAWNIEHGFDVRLLDESEENSELVITDWRDLRIRDVIWWSGDSNHSEGEYRVFALEISSYESDHPICVGDDDDNEWIDISSEKWKFIRRP